MAEILVAQVLCRGHLLILNFRQGEVQAVIIGLPLGIHYEIVEKLLSLNRDLSGEWIRRFLIHQFL